ncbi:MAG: hypothetical protein R2752_16105 [Vicinamibacterales bacterium]
MTPEKRSAPDRVDRPRWPGRPGVRLLTLAVLAALAGVAAFAWWDQAGAASTPFAAEIARLSEPGGDFGGDNLISNEQSYLRVLPALGRSGATGGGYVGVGPDQNFSYIARVRPEVAFLIDIRRDNLLLHLLFKAIFELAPTRVEYLCLLTGRAPPADPGGWRDAPVARLVAHVDGAARWTADEAARRARAIDEAIGRTGVGLSAADLATIHRFHRAFMTDGLDLVFQARGQPRRWYYPVLRDLLLETDGAGAPGSFLATAGGYDVVRSLEGRDRVIPIVGDLAGPKALRAIGRALADRGLTLSALYVSNVEYYLFREGRFGAFAANLASLPRSDRSVIIRSVFPSGFRGPLPGADPDHYSASLLQSLPSMLDDLAAGRYRRYGDLIAASVR